jgi:hypothetical protein
VARDDDAIVEAMAEAMQAAKRSPLPWHDLPGEWQEGMRAQARAALAVVRAEVDILRREKHDLANRLNELELGEALSAAEIMRARR